MSSINLHGIITMKMVLFAGKQGAGSQRKGREKTPGLFCRLHPIGASGPVRYPYLTSILRGKLFSLLGREMVNTPFVNSALMPSTSTALPRLKVRLKVT